MNQVNNTFLFYVKIPFNSTLLFDNGFIMNKITNIEIFTLYSQFAHHVVTILLHEDLDIEDEPLTAGDDFFHDIYNIRKGKTRDRQKKAAVQFLRSAVCCVSWDLKFKKKILVQSLMKLKSAFLFKSINFLFKKKYLIFCNARFRLLILDNQYKNCTKLIDLLYLSIQKNGVILQ